MSVKTSMKNITYPVTNRRDFWMMSRNEFPAQSNLQLEKKILKYYE